MKTFSAKAAEVDRKWWLIDAQGQPLGRVAAKAAVLLRGKHKAIWTPHVDTGDFVVVVNAEKVTLSPAARKTTRFTLAFRVSSAVTRARTSSPAAPATRNCSSSAPCAA